MYLAYPRFDELCNRYEEFADNLKQTFDNLTKFDLSILKLVYSNTFIGQSIEKELFQLFIDDKVNIDFAKASLKKLAHYGLIDEQMDIAGYLKLDNSYMPAPLFLQKNRLGQTFYKAIFF